MTRSTRSLRTTAAALLVATTALVGALGVTPADARRPAAPEAAPSPQADYRFDGNLASSVPGAPSLRHINANGNNAFMGGELFFPEGNGLRLGNATSVMGRGRYTIAIRMRFDAVASYARIVNFKPDDNPNADTGLYAVDADIVFYDRFVPDNDVLSADTWFTVVLTRAVTGRLRGYVNGIQQFDLMDPNGRARIDANNVLRFFRDNANREESGGAVTRIRLWDAPLTPAQVAALS